MLTPMRGSSQRQDWDDLAVLDPLWAILADPGRRFGGWDREAFLQTGRETIDAVLRDGAPFGRPIGRHDALDFGCGAGRLTRALSEHFERCLGLDISPQMIGEARENTRDVRNCRFAVLNGMDLASLDTSSFDLVVSYLVLQHVTAADVKARYVAEFVRILSPGGLLAFQLPSQISAWRLIQPGPRVYGLLRRLGVPRAVLYQQLRLHPIRMSFLTRSHVLALINAAGGRTLNVRERTVAVGVTSTEYLVTKDE
jgi:SAM-dependent methyltransferase